MADSYDDVSNIHRRYSLTLINPSSFYTSLIFSIVAAIVLITTTVLVYLKTDDLIFRIALVIPILMATQYLDSRFVKRKEYSKSLHMSFFGNILWLAIVLSGLLAMLVLSKNEASMFLVVEGMFLFAGFRIGLFTTTLGVSMKKAWALCFIQPFAMFLALIPFDLWIPIFSNVQTLLIGFSFPIIATVWSFLTDRAGRPGVKSTHHLVQAYLASKKVDSSHFAESIIEENSYDSQVSTIQIRFNQKTKNNDFRLILPGIHPGPFHPVGGSNIPYLIYKNMGSSAMILHSVSDHSLNLPSQKQVVNYLDGLSKSSVTENNLLCSEPVAIQINKGHVTGFLLNKSALLFLSLSPHGMEDLPSQIKTEIEQLATNRNFENVLIVDCHNAMGEEISKNDYDDLLKATKSCLDTLITKELFPIEFGYANSDDMELQQSDLGPSGIGVLCLKINNKKYFLGWADANNMENGVRESIVNNLAKKDINLLEICTSDTHFVLNPVRTKQGYYQFGIISKTEQISNWFLELTENAQNNLDSATIEILENKTNLKVMGTSIYQNFSKALDGTLKISKLFVIGIFVFVVLTMFL